MVVQILQIVDKILGIFIRRHDKQNKPEALRQSGQIEIDKAVASGDGRTVTRLIDADLKRLQDRRGNSR